MITYLPHTPAEISQMLAGIGVTCIEELFSEIPENILLHRDLCLPPGLSETEVIRNMSMLASKNSGADECVCFLGGGVYDHVIPGAIKHLVQRGDFFTAYTPYQAEVCQGTLQAIYEYQSLICELTNMDYSNASLYDGATALTEAALMALSHTRKKKLIVSQTVHPEYQEVLKCLLKYSRVEIVSSPMKDGVIDLSRLSELIDSQTAAVIVQYPNFFGCIEDLEAVSDLIKKAVSVGDDKPLFIVSTYPLSLGLLSPPGDFGADIVAGEGQSLGIPLNFGGPSLGFLAVRDFLLRKIPGRIAGGTVDKSGAQAFVLTLQTREQHIRREKATSNICTNQALMALTATIYLSLLGKDGLREAAYQSMQKSHALKGRLEILEKVTIPFPSPFFNEFVIKIPNAKSVVHSLTERKILPGLLLETWYPSLKDFLMVAVTEKRSLHELNFFAQELEGLFA